MTEKHDNKHIFNKLRKEYDHFTFEKYIIDFKHDYIEITYHFNLSDIYYFNPKISIPIKSFFKEKNITPKHIESIVFNIGMIELISYWKTCCTKNILIKAGYLSPKQIDFWTKLYFWGLGEFFYLNSIDTDISSFTNITTLNNKSHNYHNEPINGFPDECIVPIGGGKDSIVSLEILKKQNITIRPLMINPGKASKDSVLNAGFSLEDCIIISRKIDPLLLELNRNGYLNGHTPFSALLGFITVLASRLTGIYDIALSNENSANESTIINTKINHQYSKSFEFENDFREYVSRFISPDINYFSFLRPLNEMQIAMIFSKFKNHYFSFRSCNAGSKTNSWCCNCPKCLFIYIILSPFITQDRLKHIFGENLLNKQSLKNYFEQLSGFQNTKPFECVGTIEEVNISSYFLIDSIVKDHLPFLITEYKTQIVNNQKNNIAQTLDTIHTEHNLPEKYLKILKSELYD